MEKTIEILLQELGEGIAKAIEAKHSHFCQYQVQYFREEGHNDFMPGHLEVFDKCSHLKDADIARTTK